MSIKCAKEGFAKITALIDAFEAQGMDESGINVVADDCLKILWEYGLIHKTKVCSKFVGVHAANRGGLGFVAPIEVQLLLKQILSSKFSESLVENALALQLPPPNQDVEGDKLRKFNVDLALKSSGLLASVDGPSLLSVTLRCGHTNAALRCCLLGAKCAIPELKNYCDDQGNFSLDKLRELEPRTYAAAVGGIEFNQIRWEAAVAEPRLCPILIKADNVSHHAARIDTDWQMINEIKLIGDQQSGAKTKDQWKAIAEEAVRSRPMHASEVTGYATFVETVEPILNEVIPIVNKYICQLKVRRSIRGNLWAGLAEGALLSCPRLTASIICAMMGTSKHEGGQSRLFVGQDFKALKSRLNPMAMKAESLMKAMEELGEQVAEQHMSKEKVIDIRLGEYVKMVHFIFQKSNTKEKSLDHFAWGFFDQLTKELGDEHNLHAKGFGPRPAAEKEQQQQQKMSASSNKLLLQLKSRGFVPQCIVKKIAANAGETMQIHKISPARVSVMVRASSHPDEPGNVVHVPLVEFMDTYKFVGPPPKEKKQDVHNAM